MNYFDTHRKRGEFKDVSRRTKPSSDFVRHFFPTYRDNLEIKSRAEYLFFLVLNSFLKVTQACLNCGAFFPVRVDLISGSLASQPTLSAMRRRRQIDGRRIHDAALVWAPACALSAARGI